jgi:hypothetical protein
MLRLLCSKGCLLLGCHINWWGSRRVTIFTIVRFDIVICFLHITGLALIHTVQVSIGIGLNRV